MKTKLKDLLTRFQSSGHMPFDCKKNREIVQQEKKGQIGKSKGLQKDPGSPVISSGTIH
ncbi:MAG: hypothetical protein JW731_14540 [Bacteroidales bacterium]|nr:hypothetical protein [Bacteroidales bacterium]